MFEVRKPLSLSSVYLSHPTLLHEQCSKKNETLVGKSRVGISNANTTQNYPHTLHTRVTMNVQLWGGFSDQYTHTKEFRHRGIK